MSEPIRVGLLFGGRSVEHEVSVDSARGVAEAMTDTDLACVPIGVTEQGRWLDSGVSGEVLAGTARRVESRVGDESGLVLEPGRPGRLPVDVVFPLVHGWGGEDGRLQGALELCDLPYVGSGVLGSAVAMDKQVSKRLLRAAGLDVAPGLDLSRREYAADRSSVHERILAELGLPVFVKPANGGSSVGVSRVPGPEALAAALELALDCDRRVVVERAIDAREIECAVLGNEEPQASVPGEILPSREFYDYAAKYEDGTSETVIPADLPGPELEAIREMAVRAFRAHDLAGLARVDFLIDRQDGKPHVNELNTLPGFTPISMFARMWEASGLAFPRLVERLVELAFERSRSEAKRRVRREDGPGAG